MHLPLYQLFVFIYFSQVSGNLSETIKDIIPAVQGLNDTAFLRCTVVNKVDSSVVMWSKYYTDGSPSFLISENDEIVFPGREYANYDIMKITNGRETTYMLAIRDLTEEYAGEYMCTVKQRGVPFSEWPSKIGILTVNFPPVILANPNRKAEVAVGENLNLTCEARGVPNPNITWSREDGGVLPGGGIRYRGSFLQLRNVEKKDRGNFVCTADNNIEPSAVLVVTVKVLRRPSCMAVRDVVKVAQNRRFNANLRCICDAYPQPSIQWEKFRHQGWESLVNDDKYDIREQFGGRLGNDGNWYTLLIRNVLASDYTRYRCTGRNIYGEGSATIVLQEPIE